MPTNNPSSSSTLRSFGHFKQPESDPINPTRYHDPLELQESDVVWSFAVSPGSPPPTSPSPPSHHHHHRLHRFNPARSGLSAALSDDPHRLVSWKSSPRAIATPAARREDVPAKVVPRSAPVNIPVWAKDRGDKYSKKLDEVGYDDDDGEEVNGGGGGEEEMVPPHVIVARSHVTFSVFEGVGRTLKGRDLRRVRNTVFQKTGFID